VERGSLSAPYFGPQLKVTFVN